VEEDTGVPWTEAFNHHLEVCFNLLSVKDGHPAWVRVVRLDVYPIRNQFRRLGTHWVQKKSVVFLFLVIGVFVLVIGHVLPALLVCFVNLDNLSPLLVDLQ